MSSSLLVTESLELLGVVFVVFILLINEDLNYQLTVYIVSFTALMFSMRQ